MCYSVRMKKENPISIDAATRDAIARIAKTYDLEFVVLFGSQATGHTHPGSDIDIGFTASRTLTLERQLALREELAHIFRRDDVEAVNLRTVSPSLQKDSVRSAQVLFDTDSAFDRFTIYAHKLYIEAAPLRALRANYLRATAVV